MNEDELYEGNNDSTDKVTFFTNEKCLASYDSSFDTNTVNFYLDSATTRHIVQDISLFSTFLKLDKHEFITLAKKEVKLCVTGVGSVDVQARDGTKVNIKNVRFAADIPVNLLSVRHMAESGFICVFFSDRAEIIFANTYCTNNVKVLATTRCVNTDLYSVSFNLPEAI